MLFRIHPISNPQAERTTPPQPSRQKVSRERFSVRSSWLEALKVAFRKFAEGVRAILRAIPKVCVRKSKIVKPPTIPPMPTENRRLPPELEIPPPGPEIPMNFFPKTSRPPSTEGEENKTELRNDLTGDTTEENGNLSQGGSDVTPPSTTSPDNAKHSHVSNPGPPNLFTSPAIGKTTDEKSAPFSPSLTQNATVQAPCESPEKSALLAFIDQHLRREEELETLLAKAIATLANNKQELQKSAAPNDIDKIVSSMESFQKNFLPFRQDIATCFATEQTSPELALHILAKYQEEKAMNFFATYSQFVVSTSHAWHRISVSIHDETLRLACADIEEFVSRFSHYLEMHAKFCNEMAGKVASDQSTKIKESLDVLSKARNTIHQPAFHAAKELVTTERNFYEKLKEYLKILELLSDQDIKEIYSKTSKTNPLEQTITYLKNVVKAGEKFNAQLLPTVLSDDLSTWKSDEIDLILSYICRAYKSKEFRDYFFQIGDTTGEGIGYHWEQWNAFKEEKGIEKIKKRFNATLTTDQEKLLEEFSVLDECNQRLTRHSICIKAIYEELNCREGQGEAFAQILEAVELSVSSINYSEREKSLSRLTKHFRNKKVKMTEMAEVKQFNALFTLANVVPEGTVRLKQDKKNKLICVNSKEFVKNFKESRKKWMKKEAKNEKFTFGEKQDKILYIQTAALLLRFDSNNILEKEIDRELTEYILVQRISYIDAQTSKSKELEEERSFLAQKQNALNQNGVEKPKTK